MSEYGRSRVLPSMVGRDLSKIAVLRVVAVVWGCGRSGPSGAPSAENATQPSQPTLPAPSFSAAQKIGLFVYPKDNQTKDEQLRDELDCHKPGSAANRNQSRNSAASGSFQLASASGAATSGRTGSTGSRSPRARSGEGCGWRSHDRRDCWRRGQRSCSRGGGRDNARRQAAAPGERGVKAASGTMGGLGMQQQYQQTLAAYNGQLDTFKRGFTACMDSRSYSVK